MKKTKGAVGVIGIAICVILAAGFGIVWLESPFGNRNGNVFSLTNFDAEGMSVLTNCLRISPSSEIQFKHASMVGGKDWTLCVCIEVSKAGCESLLKSVSFTTRKGLDRDVPLEKAALPWWKIEKEKVDTVLRATEGYTALIVVNDDPVQQVFIYTDGGSSGFSKEVWDLFENQQ
jgi:hypothetical protein